MKEFFQLLIILFLSLPANASLENQINDFERFWSPFVFYRTNKTLSIKIQNDGIKFITYATRDMRDNPIIVISKNLIEHPDLTPDGINFILCHELGHHLGGAPKKMRGRGDLKKDDWPSVEGQADYFASVKCLPKYFSFNIENKSKLSFYSQYSKEDIISVKKICNDHLCERIVLAGLSFSRFYSTFRTDWIKPVPGRPVNFQVYKTLPGHPIPQCRLDTIIEGTRCQNFFDFDHQDPRVGACMDGPGKRPGCWFAY